MVFSQLSGCDSVRDVSNGLKSATGNLNHLGISRAPSKSTVAYQNANRDSGVFREIFYTLFQHFGQQATWQRKGFRFYRGTLQGPVENRAVLPQPQHFH